jgi:hypothetical protein
MPLYQFALHNGHRLDDQEATEFLPDDRAAREEALQIIHDLKEQRLRLEGLDDRSDGR